jgi:hypothetical protein
LERELLDLSAHLRRVCRAIGESMTGNLQYWQANGASAGGPADQSPRQAPRGPKPRAKGSRGGADDVPAPPT